MEVRLKKCPNFLWLIVDIRGRSIKLTKPTINFVCVGRPARAGFNFLETKMLTVFHDDPAVTEEEKLLQRMYDHSEGTKRRRNRHHDSERREICRGTLRDLEAEFQAAWIQDGRMAARQRPSMR